MEKDARLIASSDNQQQQYAKFKMKDKEMNKSTCAIFNRRGRPFEK